MRAFTALLVCVAAMVTAALLVPAASSARPERAAAVRTVHKARCVLRFFRNHPRQARTAIGQREVRLSRARLARARATARRLESARRSDWLVGAFTCIHRYEGAWNANTGNGYYGGLQMDGDFMAHYGAAYERRWGTADRWPAWAQIATAIVAYRSGRGFWPWPNTARACGLL